MEAMIKLIAERIRGLREILEISPQEMSEVTGVTLQEYNDLENGNHDFSFTFLMKCAERFGVDIVELLTGDNPKLTFYTVVRSGKGLPIQRREGFQYHHLAYLFKNKLAEPFFVTAPYSGQEQNRPPEYSTHNGQEFDFILKGRLKIDFKGKTETLNTGDAIYYDSSHPHGMVAVGGADCDFLAVVLKGPKVGKEEKPNARTL